MSVSAEASSKSATFKRGFNILARNVRNLIEDREIRDMVDLRIREFKELRKKGTERDWFSELCFCLLTANSSARLGMKIQKALGKRCASLSQKDVERLLIEHGHRFSRARADYICRARGLRDIIGNIEAMESEKLAREWLVENILGLGYKEASHFLRNTGHFDVAILDRHILSLMEEHGLISEIPKSLTRKRYLEIEKKLEELAEQIGMPVGALDLYLWYMKTGEVLK